MSDQKTKTMLMARIVTPRGHFGCSDFCQQSVIGVRPMAFPPFGSMGRRFDETAKALFRGFASSTRDECRLVLEMHSVKL